MLMQKGKIFHNFGNIFKYISMFENVCETFFLKILMILKSKLCSARTMTSFSCKLNWKLLYSPCLSI